MTQDMKVYGKFTDMFKYVIEGINNKLVFNEVTSRHNPASGSDDFRSR